MHLTRKNALKAVGLMGGRTAFRAIIGLVIGGHIGIASALFFTLVTNFMTYWLSDRIPIGMARAELVDASEFPNLCETVARLAERVGLPRTPRVYFINASAPNAFAAGRHPQHAAVAVTRGALEMLTQDELEAVLAHELVHIMQRDTLVAAIVTTLVGATTGMLDLLGNVSLSLGITRSAHYAELLQNRWTAPIGRFLVYAGAVTAALLFPLGIARGREFDADAQSACITGRPLALASALEKLDAIARRTRPLPANPAIASLFIVNPLCCLSVPTQYSTHPPVTERVERLARMVAACVEEDPHPMLIDNELFAFPTLFEGGVQRYSLKSNP